MWYLINEQQDGSFLSKSLGHIRWMSLILYFMIGLIEVASHYLCLWQAALLPPLERNVERVTSLRTSRFLHYSRPHRNLIFYLYQSYIQGSSRSHKQFSIRKGQGFKTLHFCVWLTWRLNQNHAIYCFSKPWLYNSYIINWFVINIRRIMRNMAIQELSRSVYYI